MFDGRDYLYGTPFTASVAECAACGLWFQSPRLPRERHVELYPSDYTPHAGTPHDGARSHPAIRSYLKRYRGYVHLAGGPVSPGLRAASSMLRPLLHWRVGVDLIPAYVGDGCVLDIGCGGGAMLSLLGSLGWEDLHGIEPDPEAAALAGSTGATVLNGTVEDTLPTYPDGHFDAIVASMVVEHVSDPFAVVRGIARKLRPGGELLISTVTRDSAQAAFFGEYWAGFDFPRHMVYFRSADIAALLADDFHEIEWFNQLAPVDWIRSASWRGQPIDKVFTRLGKIGWLAPSVAVTFLGRSTRVSLRCRRKPAARA